MKKEAPKGKTFKAVQQCECGRYYTSESVFSAEKAKGQVKMKINACKRHHK